MSTPPGRFLIRSAPAFALLFIIHARHSLPALLHAHVPPDLGYGAGASVALQLLQVAVLAYLMAIYGLALREWRRQPWTPRQVVVAAGVLTACAWTLVPANSSDI